MNLSAKQLSDVLGALRVGRAESPGAERRKFTRIDVQGVVHAADVAGGRIARCYSALTRDISFSGLGILRSSECPAGQEILLRLPQAGGPPLLLQSRVTHSQVVADGLFGVGMEFVREVKPQDVLGLGGREEDLDRVRKEVLV